MDYITLNTLQSLKDVGFSYPEYEHFLNNGMLFYYQGDEYFIGGYSNGNFSKQDMEIARNGVWLPEASQLLAWLVHTGFRVTITNEENGYYNIQAIDLINGSEYKGKDLTFANTLAVVIKKICKSQKREYIPEVTFRLQIID